jgi:hypothetical protein
VYNRNRMPLSVDSIGTLLFVDSIGVEELAIC